MFALSENVCIIKTIERQQRNGRNEMISATIQDPAFKAGFMSELASKCRAVPSTFGFTLDESKRFYKGYDAATDLDTGEHAAAAQKYFRYGVV